MTSMPSTSDGFKTPPPMPPGHVYTPYNKLVTSSQPASPPTENLRASSLHATHAPASTAHAVSIAPAPAPAELDAATALCFFKMIGDAKEASPSNGCVRTYSNDSKASQPGSPPLTSEDHTPPPPYRDSFSIVEEKHRSWQEKFQVALDACGCEVTQCLLRPATHLDAIETALHLSRLQPKEMVLLHPALRRIVANFQVRANALGIIDAMPRLIRVQAVRKRSALAQNSFVTPVSKRAIVRHD